MKDEIGERVSCKEDALEEAMEVDGGVVGEEGSAEVNLPGHNFLFFSFSNFKI